MCYCFHYRSTKTTQWSVTALFGKVTMVPCFRRAGGTVASIVFVFPILMLFQGNNCYVSNNNAVLLLLPNTGLNSKV